MRDGTESCFHENSQDEVTCLNKHAKADHRGHLYPEQEKARSCSESENYWGVKANLF